MKLGCIGQGFVGKPIADYLEAAGYEVVRYALEPEYKDNKDEIATCDVVFIAVPTPTSPGKFDDSIIEDSLSLVGDGKIAVIKSTSLPGTAHKMQAKFPNKIIIASPEFLSEATAAYDVTNPIMQIIGLPEDTSKYHLAAQKVVEVNPKVKHTFIVPARTAELFKYKHNVHGYFRIMLTNLMYEVATEHGIDWQDIERMAAVDPMMSPWYNTPVHKGGRGAGGNCFIKDMAAFRTHYEAHKGDDERGLAILRALEEKNLELLRQTKKDAHIVKYVYDIDFETEAEADTADKSSAT